MARTLASARTSAMIDSKMSPRGVTSSSEKLKLSIAMAVIFFLIAALLIITLQFDHVPKQIQPLQTPESFNNSTQSDGCHTPDCEVEWFPPRTWTQPSKYSAVASSQQGLQMYGTLAAQQAIWTHQHPSTCHDKKFLIYEAQEGDNGIGSMIHVAGVALQAALNTNRILVLAPQPNVGWVQGQFCEGLDTMDECYFEPISSCTIYDAFGSDLEVTNENFLRFAELDMVEPINAVSSNERVLRTAMRNMQGSQIRFAAPVMFQSMLERGNVSVGFYYWWRAQSTAYFMRPTLRTLRELDRRKKSEVFQGQLIEPGTISVHVRHGDKWRESKLQPDSEYLRTAEALLAQQPDVLQRRIFLSTEDPNTVSFFAQLSNWAVQYTNVSRIADPSVSPADFARKIGWDEEFLNSLLSLQLALECDGFVGSIESNWVRLIDQLRSTVKSKFHKGYADVVQGFHVQDYKW